MQRGGIRHGMRVCLLTVSASLALLVASAPTAWGQSAPTVVYDGASEQIVFEGADGTDLLLGAKDLMPGDAIEQSVRVEARNLRRPVELFVEAVFEGPVPGLENVEVAVLLDGREIARGPLATQHGMAEPISLRTLDADGSRELLVCLNVPVEVGNETMEAVQALDWRFVAEDRAAGGAGGNLAQTGDGTWLVLAPFVLAGTVLVTCGLRSRARG